MKLSISHFCHAIECFSPQCFLSYDAELQAYDDHVDNFQKHGMEWASWQLICFVLCKPART